MQTINAFLIRLFAALTGNLFVAVLLLTVCGDMIFGTLRAAKYRCWNSSIGIDGAIRKAGMVASVLLFTLMDMIVRVDLIAWLPVSVRDVLGAIGVVKMGVTELFCSLYIVYEAISVLKNMLLCDMPIPKGIRAKLAKWLDENTDETKMDMQYETGEHSELRLSLDQEELEQLTLPQLHALANEMGVEYTEDTTAEDLAAMLVAEPITTVI